MKKFIGGLFFFTFMLVLAGCGASGSTLDKAKEEGVVTIGFANEKPYAYKTADGKLTGEAVEVARAVLKEMGITEMKGELVDSFSALIPGLKAGRFDMITAGMYITPDRCKEVAFAEPEYRVGEALAVVKGNPKNLKSYENIAANPEVKVAVMAGGYEIKYLEKLGVTKNQMVMVNNNPDAIAAVAAGRADAATMTEMSLIATLESTKDENIVMVEDFKQPVIDGKSTVNYGATAFRLEDKDFRDAFNEKLVAMKESGKLKEIIGEFGFIAPDNRVTTESLCNQ